MHCAHGSATAEQTPFIAAGIGWLHSSLYIISQLNKVEKECHFCTYLDMVQLFHLSTQGPQKRYGNARRCCTPLIYHTRTCSKANTLQYLSGGWTSTTSLKKVPIFFKRTLTQVVVVVRRQVEAVDLGEAAAAAAAQTCLLYQPTQR